MEWVELKLRELCILGTLDEEEFVTVEQIRCRLHEYLGKDVIIKCSLGRNKYEKYNAKIKELYKNVFLVEIKESKIKNEIKSFSYSDVITKTIKIDY